MLFLYALVAMCLAENVQLDDGDTITLVDICDGPTSLTTNVSGLNCPVTGDNTYVAASQNYLDISVPTGSTQEYTIDVTGTDASRFGDHADLAIDRWGSTSGANLGIKICENVGCPVTKESGDWYTTSSWTDDTIHLCQPSASNYYMQAENRSGQSGGDATATVTFAVYVDASGWCELLEAFKNLGKIIVIIVVVMCAICCLCVVILIACCGMSIGGICWCCCAKKEQNATTVQMGS